MAPTLLDNRANLARSYHHAADLNRRLGRAGEAMKACLRALDIQRALAKQNQTVTAYREDLARTRATLGLLEQEAGRAAEALAAVEQALAIGQALVRKNPTANIKLNLARSYFYAGMIHQKAARRDNASGP